MPVRDAEYMRRDRRKIAAAAIELLFEKGVSDTSIRDICKRSGMSMGGVYVHFASKRDIILAAMELMAEGAADPPVACWADLVELLRVRHFSVQSPAARHYARLQMEFLGSVVVSGEESPQLRALRDRDQQWLTTVLQQLHEAGEIALPLGLEATRSALLWLSIGSAQDYFASPTIDVARAWVDKVAVMEALVGARRPVGTEMLGPPEGPVKLPDPKELERLRKAGAGRARSKE